MSIKEIYELIFLSKRNEDDNDRIRTAIEENLDIITLLVHFHDSDPN